MGLRTALGLKQKPPAAFLHKTSVRDVGKRINPPDGQRSISPTWFRGSSTNFMPSKERMRSEEGPLRYFVHGLEPEKRFVTRETKITAFGSCFAEHISAWLHERSYAIAKKGDGSNSYLIDFGDGMVNTFAIRSQFEWTLEHKVMPGEFWHGYDAKAFGYDEDVRASTEKILRGTELFIITLGLSEIWYDERTGAVFWRGVPSASYDASRHRFRVVSVAENVSNLRAIFALIRRHVPAAKVILTLSPIPLAATFRPQSCITANAASKGNLRAAIDEVMRDEAYREFLSYWPSYEIVKEFYLDPFLKDARHIKRPVLDYVMTLFETVWCVDAPSPDELRTRLRRSLRADRGLFYWLRG